MNLFKSVSFISEQSEGTLDREYRRSATNPQVDSVAKRRKQVEEPLERYC